MNLISAIYVALFANRIFAKLNKFVLKLSLKGVGILNFRGRETGETWFVMKFVASEQKTVIFDVGANDGSYASEVLRLCKEATIYAFEPHPRSYLRLKEIGGIQSFNLALGSSERELDLFDYDGELTGSEHASLFREVIETIHGSKSTSTKVACVRLDDFCEQRGIERIRFLKIDTEGNEYDVLLGADKMIREKRIDIVQFEFNEMNVISRVFMKDFFDLLRDYDLHRLLPTGLLPLSYSPLECEIFAYQNIVAILKSDPNTTC